MNHLITPFILLALAGSAFASGSSPARPPRPPRATQQQPAAPAERMDDGKYSAGKAVFTGKAPMTKNSAAAKQQRARLEALAQQSGPEGAKLPALAGKLSADQLEALDYYVAHRYPAKTARR